ncbi:unnamed protein product [Protopolystoma xenopodis]|uniref:Uncharacterized protein n=1 Tax=Protopolystoma xenopodis TaxID=117903 RepID=A0A3S5BKL4_9PLAT|nr:unnamed protein product [Protopolystoma xenopodis]
MLLSFYPVFIFFIPQCPISPRLSGKDWLLEHVSSLLMDLPPAWQLRSSLLQAGYVHTPIHNRDSLDSTTYDLSISFRKAYFISPFI